MILLSIESGAKEGSIALSVDGELIEELLSNDGDHSKNLPLCIKSLMERHPAECSHLDGVVLAMGPGSYTGLRIGCSLAKGFCYGRGLPLFIVSTLHVLFYGFCAEVRIDTEDTVYFPMIDARRFEVYTMAFDKKAKVLAPIQPVIVESEISLTSTLVNKTKVHDRYCYFGDGAKKCRERLYSDRWEYIDNVRPMARYMANIVEENFGEDSFERLEGKAIAYFEPLYIKPFIAVKGPVKGLQKTNLHDKNHDGN